MTGAGPDAADVQNVLAAVETDDRGPKMLVALEQARVLWVSADMAVLFGSSDLQVLTKMIFGRAHQARPLTTRLARLALGGGLHLERIAVATRLRRFGVTLVCTTVPAQASPLVLMHTLDGVEPRQPAPDLPAPNRSVQTVSTPRQASPVPVEPQPVAVQHRSDPIASPAPGSAPAPMTALATVTEPTETGNAGGAGEAATEPASRSVVRFVWRLDREGRVTAVGPEMAAALGSAALHIGDDLVLRLHAIEPSVADHVKALLAERRGWSGVLVRWPGEDAVVATEMEMGGSPSAADGGYRGFGVLRPVFGPQELLPNAEISADPDKADADLTSEVVATDDTEPEQPTVDVAAADADAESNAGPDAAIGPEKAVPAEVAVPQPVNENAAVAGETRPGDAGLEAVSEHPSPSRGAETVAARLGRAGLQTFSTAATSKVVHLATFKAAVPPLSGKATSRREVAQPAEANEVSLDAPTWAEAPRPLEAPDQRLSNHERFNFDEIARALAALPVGSTAVSLPGDDRPPAPPALPPAETAAPGRQGGESGDLEALLELLPLGVLVSQAERAVYANRTLLDIADCGSFAEFEAIGGLERVLGGVSSAPPVSGLHNYQLTGRNDRRVFVDGRVQKIVWRHAPATLITLRPSRDRSSPSGSAPSDLELSEARSTVADLREALDLAASGAGFLDHHGRIVSISAGAGRLFGLDARDMTGEPLLALVAADDQDAWRAFFDGFLASSGDGRTSAYRKFTFRKRSSASIVVGVSLRLMSPGKICIVWQEEQRGQPNDGELEARRRAAERSSDLKSEFLAKVSHEIRTPLNAILGFTEIIIEERFGPLANDRYREYLKDIHASGTHVVSLVNDLLDLSRIEAGGLDLNPITVNVNVVLGECVGTIQGQAHRDRVIVRSSFAAQSAFALVDERALRQIVLNLLSNAVKFNEAGGQVIVSSAISEGGQIVVRVRDTGPGMSESEVETAMKPFRQLATPKAGAGTGLGLPLTKAMVEASHGSFRIQSKPGEGTLVEVMLQRAPDRPVSMQAE